MKEFGNRAERRRKEPRKFNNRKSTPGRRQCWVALANGKTKRLDKTNIHA